MSAPSALGPRRNPMMVTSSGSKILLSDSVSRDASDGGSGCDTDPDNMIWQHVRIHGTSLRGETISKEDAGKDRHVMGVIGRWYAECEYNDKQQTPPKNAAGGPIPWGAVLPIRLEASDLSALGKESIRRWSGVLQPRMQHTFSVFLFYALREANEDDLQDYEEDRANNPNVEDLGPLYYVAVLYFPIEREAIHDNRDSLNEVLTSEKLQGYLNRRYSLYSKSVPHNAIHVMKPGEVINQAIRYDRQTLADFDKDDQLVSRFLDSYVRIVLELGQHAGNREVVARDYWTARRELHPEVFAAVDARNRMVLYACYLRAYCTDKAGAQRIEDGIVRLMRYIYELGWPNEHNIVEYVYWCGLDQGRVSPDLTVAGTPSAQRRTASITPANKKSLSRLITSTRTSFAALKQTYVEQTAKNALPTLGESVIPMIPPDLECLSKRATIGGLERDWIRRANGTYVGLCESDHICAGDAFLVAEGYPTRFFHESDPERDDSYSKIAYELFLLQKPSASSDEFQLATLPIKGGKSVIIYPALIFESLAALRAELGADLWQACHKPSELFAYVGPIERDLSSRDWRLTSIQPSIGSAMDGIKKTLWPSSMATEEGTPLSVVPTELVSAVVRSKNLYQLGHPSEPNAALVPPTVFWLRPLQDIVGSNPAPETMKILEQLPTVDIDSTSGKRALVLAYREWPFALSEAVRCQLHRFRDKLIKQHNGNIITMMRQEFGSENPANLVALTDRINAVLLKNANCGGLCLELDRITDMQVDELEDHYKDVQPPSPTIVHSAEDHAPLPERAPNGLRSTDDLTVARNRKMARDAGSRKDTNTRLWQYREMFTTCDLAPERARDAVWLRGDNDPKKSISVQLLEKDGKHPQTFRWYDFKVGVGFVGSQGLSAYAYVLLESNNESAVKNVLAMRKEQRWGSPRLVHELLSILTQEKRAAYWTFLDRNLKPLYESLTAHPHPPPDEAPKPKKARTASAPNGRGVWEAVLRLWRTGLAITGPGLAYLRSTRGLWNISPAILEQSPFLRYSSHLVYNQSGEALSDSKIHPGLLCFLTDAAGHSEPGSVQRIFLTPDGKKFVPRSAEGKVKLTLGSSTGRAWCAQPGRAEHLGYVYLCEGPEKALAIASCSRYAPCFASMGLSNMRNFAHLRDLDPQPTLVVCGDADHTISLQQEEIKALKRSGWKRVIHWLPWCAGSSCGCKDANDVMVNHTVLTLISQLSPHLPLWAAAKMEVSSDLVEEPSVEWQRYSCLLTK